MNAKKLAKKLEKKTQQIIEDVACECDKPIHYILCGHGSASVEVSYHKVDIEKLDILSQDGKIHTGYLSHECSKKGRE